MKIRFFITDTNREDKLKRSVKLGQSWWKVRKYHAPTLKGVAVATSSKSKESQKLLQPEFPWLICPRFPITNEQHAGALIDFEAKTLKTAVGVGGAFRRKLWLVIERSQKGTANEWTFMLALNTAYKHCVRMRKERTTLKMWGPARPSALSYGFDIISSAAENFIDIRTFFARCFRLAALSACDKDHVLLSVLWSARSTVFHAALYTPLSFRKRKLSPKKVSQF